MERSILQGEKPAPKHQPGSGRSCMKVQWQVSTARQFATCAKVRFLFLSEVCP
jgi:hypothetical protein